MKLRFLLAVACIVARTPLFGLPTMIRLGYPNCVSCHYAPQGGGLLNQYGKGIDQAQSLRGGEYQPATGRFYKAINWNGRVTQDVRGIGQETTSSSTGQPWPSLFRNRSMYRNTTRFGKGLRISTIVLGETLPTPRPDRIYDRAITPGYISLNSALLQYRPTENLEFAVGRDALPSGVLVSDLTSFVKSRNRMGYYDTPTQLKMFLSKKRFQLAPYLFAPSGHEAPGQKEYGGGGLAEFDVLGNQETIVGVNVLHASALKSERQIAGAYTRLGFGRWGILAEHDVTDRTFTSNATTAATNTASFRQQASYGQVFFAAREWLVPSLIAERLTVEKPYAERLAAAKIDVAIRLSSQVTMSVNFRLQKNMTNGVWSPSAGVQVTVKSVR